MPDVFKVSQSKVKVWRRCRRAYHYRYVEKIRRKTKPRSLAFGSLVHKMIEADLNGDDPFDYLDQQGQDGSKLFAAEQQELDQLIQEVSWIMQEYFEHWEGQPRQFRAFRKGGKSAEHKFSIELLDGILWEGLFDAIGIERSSRWLIEHKTFKRKPTNDDRWRNLQSSTYIRANDLLGWKPLDGVCWDYIWSKPPAKPQLLQNGKLSSKSIDTLPSRVVEALKEYGLKPSDHKSFLQAVARNRTKWFDRIFTPVQKSVVDEVFDDFQKTVVEMSELHGKVKDRNIERHCTWCDYEPLCRAAMQGLDYDYVKERQYGKSDRPEEDADDIIHKVELQEDD